jgi:outer membrane protein TolC
MPWSVPSRAELGTGAGRRTGDFGRVTAEQIKAKLAALRAAKQKAAQDLATARQSLRQLMTLRQEALLVLNGLLD